MVVLYTINCQKCKVLELKLKKANIEFETVSDADEVIKVWEEHKDELKSNGAPFLQVDDKFYDYVSAVKYINEGK